mmetsp:Transcript_22922/g.39253  ORF Transcript_22922/g.39253 Transcript_22922/m.39253 type:complete len:251 (+) Transcript_22922:5700-6452(+)
MGSVLQSTFRLHGDTTPSLDLQLFPLWPFLKTLFCLGLLAFCLLLLILRLKLRRLPLACLLLCSGLLSIGDLRGILKEHVLALHLVHLASQLDALPHPLLLHHRNVELVCLFDLGGHSLNLQIVCHQHVHSLGDCLREPTSVLLHNLLELCHGLAELAHHRNCVPLEWLFVRSKWGLCPLLLLGLGLRRGRLRTTGDILHFNIFSRNARHHFLVRLELEPLQERVLLPVLGALPWTSFQFCRLMVTLGIL